MTKGWSLHRYLNYKEDNFFEGMLDTSRKIYYNV